MFELVTNVSDLTGLEILTRVDNSTIINDVYQYVGFD